MKGFDLGRRLSRLKLSPIFQQFSLMQLSLCLDQTLLSSRKSTGIEFDCVDGDHCGLSLMVGVEMRPVMSLTGFHKHPNHNAVEARDFRPDRASIQFAKGYHR